MMANAYKNSIARAFFSLYRDTVTILTDNGAIPSSTDHSNDQNVKLLETIYFQRAIQAYWLGHIKRCQFYTEKYLEDVKQISFFSNFMLFIYGLSSFELQKRKTSIKLRAITKRSIRMLKTSASYSSWNSQNKVSTSTRRHLLLLVSLFDAWSPTCTIYYPIGPSLRGWTVFTRKQKQRSPSILCRLDQLRTLIWVHSRARSGLWARWPSLQTYW